MNVKLNKRLSTLSAFIDDNCSVIDIGCDHGLLGIYLYQNRNNIKIISSDVNALPLKKAYDNLIKYDLVSKIELKLGNGLECINSDTDTVIISGMGGVTIIEILSCLKRFSSVKKLVISPNSDFVLTRKKLCKLGFKINNEVMVKENNKYYLVSEYIVGKNRVNSFFGKLDLDNDIVIGYYRDLYNKNKNILNSIPRRYILKRIKLLYYNYLISKIIK